MKQKLLLLMISILMISCWSDIDDTNIECNSNCTTLTGRIVTEGGSVPAVGLKFNLDWIVKSELGGTYRNIKNFTTDNNGYFSISFYAKDLELKWHGNYSINYLDTDKNFIDFKEYPGIGNVSLNKRDTIVNKILLLPKRSSIKIRILNPGIETSCNLHFKYGELNSNVLFYSGGTIYSVEQSEKILEAAGNQINYISIYKKINNNLVSTEDSIFVPIGDTIVYEVK
jgi:hypothetical protein